MDDWEKRRAVDKMRSSLMYMESYRKRAQGLERIHSLLGCETPGTVREVGVAGRRWRFWGKGGARDSAEEIVLTDDERREFAAWCEARSVDLTKQADEIEHRYAVREE